mmetsp:Transcript_47788/g.85340  ORF Transcript_47788/g.85340 Transcript_47788/m.85340 type:complete len:81 (+) Transcript_47788:321-563(+)
MPFPPLLNNSTSKAPPSFPLTLPAFLVHSLSTPDSAIITPNHVHESITACMGNSHLLSELTQAQNRRSRKNTGSHVTMGA